MSQQQPQLNVTLIGDSCIDEYVYGRVDRISPEAPVPIFIEESRETKYGMAANVQSNLEALGIKVTCHFGDRISTKTRIVDNKSKYQLIRIDNDRYSDPIYPENVVNNDTDAYVISDYNKGSATYHLIEELIKTNKPVFIDTKKTDLKRFNGGIVKINSLEESLITSANDNLIITNGKDNVLFKDKEYKVPHVEITDVCGAGDTFLSALVYQYLTNNKNLDRAIPFAIAAASVTVRHLGVYAPTLMEIYLEAASNRA